VSDRASWTPNQRTKHRKERRKRQKAAMLSASAQKTVESDWKTKKAELPARRARKFEAQGGICHWFMVAERTGGKSSRCPDPSGRMTLELLPDGRAPKNYASFEHLQRRRDGGGGKPDNVVLACLICNTKREHGVHFRHRNQEPRKAENVAAERVGDGLLLDGAKQGTLNAAERGELYRRGLVPNWPMWSRLVATSPPGAF
jgi:hypothetical protein